MSNLQRRADIPVCHRGFNACPEYDELENPSSGMPSKQDFNYGRFAVIKTNGGLDSINERPAATVKKSLTVKTDGELCPNPVVQKFWTTAANGKTYDVAHYNQGPSRNQVGTQPELMDIRVLRLLVSNPMGKAQLSEPGRSPITGQVSGQVPGQVDPWVIRALIACSVKPISSRKIQESTGLRHRETFQRNYFDQLISDGLVERTIPEKPTSRLQQYRLTEKGRRLLAQLDKDGGLS